IGNITFQQGEAYTSSLESPRGVQICSGVLCPEKKVDGAIPKTIQYASLRVIPNPQNAAEPSLCQLIGSKWVLVEGELWSGRGSPSFTGASALDPYHELPMVAPLTAELQQDTGLSACALFIGSMSISDVEVLENL